MIRLVKYILLLAVVAMLYKTFYYDYQKKEIPAEENASEAKLTNTVEPTRDNRVDETNKTGWQSTKGMPIDRLGDSIGDSLKDKIKVK